jgi:hypothetical protein
MMGAVLPFSSEDLVFEPEAMQAMAAAFDAACAALKLPDNAARAREVVAVRIIELARRGEQDPIRLSEHVVRDAGSVR